MKGRVAGLFRHPVKGFTPEPLDRATLGAGRHFPCDRLYAVENGPSGFDAGAPAHISKMRFTVLAKIPKVAAIRTRFEPDAHVFHAETAGRAPFAGSLLEQSGRNGFTAWLTGALEGEIDGPLKVVHADGHSFMDHPTKGFVSVLNLASVRAVADRLGVTVDPARFRANITVDFGEPFIENACVGARLAVGAAGLEVLSITRRCVATHVDPATAAVDIDMCGTLLEMTGAPDLGLYCAVAAGGAVCLGDRASLA